MTAIEQTAEALASTIHLRRKSVRRKLIEEALSEATAELEKQNTLLKSALIEIRKAYGNGSGEEQSARMERIAQEALTQ